MDVRAKTSRGVMRRSEGAKGEFTTETQSTRRKEGKNGVLVDGWGVLSAG